MRVLVFGATGFAGQHLCRELLARGHQFRTDHSDTEVIVHGYEEWGAGVVERLEGMFGIGIWDQSRRRLFLARDRVGIKPLYFGWVPQGFVFASEIKSLLAFDGVPRRPNASALPHYLVHGYAPSLDTMFEGSWSPYRVHSPQRIHE